MVRRRGWKRGEAGSVVLLVLAALVIARPDLGGLMGEEEGAPASASALVVRAVDGDTIEARIDGEVEEFDENDVTTGLVFLIQLKGTDEKDLNKALARAYAGRAGANAVEVVFGDRGEFARRIYVTPLGTLAAMSRPKTTSPRSRKSSAVAWPMPDAAPVITTTRGAADSVMAGP